VKKLKADFHIHTWEDPADTIEYTAYQLIDKAAEKGYDVLAITNHRHFLRYEKLARFAEKMDILLIPGLELSLREGHVILLFDSPEFDYHKIRTFANLNQRRSEHTLVIAPHPFFPTEKAIGYSLINHPEYFDAVEYTMFYYRYVNFNKKAERLAQRENMPLIGVGDIHKLWQLDYTYTLVEAEKTALGVIKAVKENRVEIVTRPMPSTPKGIWRGIEFMFS